MRPQKIMIFGRPGSGKSTFAYSLAQKTGLPLYHVDKHFFTAGWVERDRAAFMRIQQEIVAGDQWIVDGNSVGSLATRWARADLVLYFNYGKICCLTRLIKRLFAKPSFIDDRAPGCPEALRWRLVKYMWTFDRRVQSIISTLRAQYPAAKFIEVKTDKALDETKKFICSLV